MDKTLEIGLLILSDAALIFLVGGAVVAILVGAWMLVNPVSLYRFNDYMNRWFSTRKAARPLMVPRNIDPFIYRHHRIIGTVVVLGSVYVLYALIFEMRPAELRALFLGSTSPAHPWAWAVMGLVVALGAGALLALVVGIYLLIRPSLLKGMEQWSNRWMTVRRATRVFDIMRQGPEPFIARHPRAVGIAIVLGGLYTLAGLYSYMVRL